MGNNNGLLKLMIAHHGLIEALFQVFRDDLGDREKAKQALDNFKWQAEKHFFVEEKTGFVFVFNVQDELYKVVQELINEHSQMMGMIGRIEMQLRDGQKVEAEGFLNMLQEHRKTEEQILYPKMEKLLSQYQKDLIIERIKEVVLKK